MSGQRVLVVDDEPQILRALRDDAARRRLRRRDRRHGRGGARRRGGAPAGGGDPRPRAAGRERHRRRAASCAPGRDAPIIVLSAVGEEREKIAALDAGADDYVTKPFGVDELLARLRAALRRAAPTQEPVIEIGDLRIDVPERDRHLDGERVQLSPHEFDLLRVLAQNEGKLLTHRTLLREVWGPAYQVEAHYLHVYVSQLRRKIEPDPSSPRYLLTEPGAGYRLVEPDALDNS